MREADSRTQRRAGMFRATSSYSGARIPEAIKSFISRVLASIKPHSPSLQVDTESNGVALCNKSKVRNKTKAEAN